MKHRIAGKKLGRNLHERQALFKSQAKSLFTYGTIKTTQAKALAVTPLVEKLSNWIMTKNDLVAIRQLHRYFQDRNLVKTIYSQFKTTFTGQNGNFTKLTKLKYRQGDNALIVKLSFVKPFSIKKEIVDKIKKNNEKVTKKTKKTNEKS